MSLLVIAGVATALGFLQVTRDATFAARDLPRSFTTVWRCGVLAENFPKKSPGEPVSIAGIYRRSRSRFKLFFFLICIRSLEKRLRGPASSFHHNLTWSWLGSQSETDGIWSWKRWISGISASKLPAIQLNTHTEKKLTNNPFANRAVLRLRCAKFAQMKQQWGNLTRRSLINNDPLWSTALCAYCNIDKLPREDDEPWQQTKERSSVIYTITIELGKHTRPNPDIQRKPLRFFGVFFLLKQTKRLRSNQSKPSREYHVQKLIYWLHSNVSISQRQQQ